MRARTSWRGWLEVMTVFATCGGTGALARPVVFAQDLALSPDGQTLLFSWAGDVWSAPITGGNATRLTVHPADDSYPVWSPDGQRIAFCSNRHGSGNAFTSTPRGARNVFVMDADGQNIRRLTFANTIEIPTDWSPDGEWIYFHSPRERDVRRQSRLFRVPAAGGQVWRALDCYGGYLRVSPDGERYAFTRGGRPWVRNSRRGYHGSANMDLYLYTPEEQTFKQLTTFDGTDRNPSWDADGGSVYFLSDRSGTVNVWRLALDGSEPVQITRMTGDDVRDFTVSRDGSTVAFTHWDHIYVLSTPNQPARAITIEAPDDVVENDIDLKTYKDNADEHEPAPDEEEIALVVRGEIFVIKTDKDKPTRRVTNSPARDRDVVWSPDGKALFFVSDRDGQEDIYRATSAEDPPKALSDSLRFKIERVTDDPQPEYNPRISPDGKKLAFVRTRGDLIIRDLKTGEESVLLASWDRPWYAWSPDSEWMAYAVEDLEHNSDVWVVPSDGSADPVNVSRHPDYDGGVEWSADGQMLAFASQRHGFDSDLYVVFLSSKLDEMATVDRDDYFKKQAEKVKKRKPLKKSVAGGKIHLAGDAPTTQPADTQPAETQPADDESSTDGPETYFRGLARGWLKGLLEGPDDEKPKDKKDEKKKDEKEDADEDKFEYELDTCYRRIRRVTSSPGDQTSFAFAPNGQSLAFLSSHEGGRKVYTIKWNGKDQKRILGSSVSELRWGLTGKKLYYLKGGVPNSCSDSGSGAKAHAFRAKMALSAAEQAAQKFNDGARQLGLRFYHPTMKGLDWSALTRKYRELALQTTTLTEFNEIFNMLLGELNASHLGIYGPRTSHSEGLGDLGCTFDPEFKGPGLRVTSILPRSPADRDESRLVPGDVILKVNGTPVGPHRSSERALINTAGDETILEFVPSPTREVEENDEKAEDSEEATTKPDQPETRELIIRPTAPSAIGTLRYDAWLLDNRKYVEDKSDGRVGYLHIRSMDVPSFERFERDLYAAAHGKDGLIIDVRSNGGGWTADWVMAVLSVRRHAYTITRGGEPGYPQDRLIFYAWTKPATMMCNEESFSNAEIISHAFKNLGRGPLVGMTTYGGVISTGGYRLIDGALVRMPGRGWYTLPDGRDMENNGAEPDVKVPITPANEVHGQRPQLDAAIKATLDQIEQQKAHP